MILSAYQALYRKWRPNVFDDVVGQEHITTTLKNEIISGRTSHAYLFCGARGTGKTSTARILSRALNCKNNVGGNPCNECESCKGILSGEIMDIIEIDAASNNGVDNIRDLREEARYGAAVTTHKVYIIDEVHMLSTGAFNALLKLLEEPPPFVVFILATTEAHKVLPTILSRCQRFDFKRISTIDIFNQLKKVSILEGFTVDDYALNMLAEASDGGLRDALGLLDRCAASGSAITKEAVLDLLGMSDKGFLNNIAKAVSGNDAPTALSLINDYAVAGKSLIRVVENLIEFFRNILLCKILNNPVGQDLEMVIELSDSFSREKLVYCISLLTGVLNSARYITNARPIVEVALVKMCFPNFDDRPDSVAARIGELERQIKRGTIQIEEKPLAKAPNPKPAKPKEVLTEDFVTINSKWAEICSEAERMRFVMALDRCEHRQEDGKLAIVFDDNDRVMLDLLREQDVIDELESLIENVTGIRAAIVLRLKSFYAKDEEFEADPLDDLDEYKFEEENDEEEF